MTSAGHPVMMATPSPSCVDRSDCKLTLHRGGYSCNARGVKEKEVTRKYPVSVEDKLRRNMACNCHVPTNDQLKRYAMVREAAAVFDRAILENAPPCDDRDAAIEGIRVVSFLANAAIARHE